MVWVLGVVVLLLMMIPLTAIVLDSEVGRALARRLGAGQAGCGGGSSRTHCKCSVSGSPSGETAPRPASDRDCGQSPA